MDILIRLRVLLWTMVLVLWGLMIYQFIGEDESVPKMRWVSTQVNEDAFADLPDLEDQIRIPAAELFPAHGDTDILTEPAGFQPSGSKTQLARIPASLNDRPSLADRLPTLSGPIGTFPKARPEPVGRGGKTVPRAPPRTQARPQPVRPTARKTPAQEAPKGFVKTETQHFIVYSQEKRASMEFLETLASLHGNLMLDLATFSPWAADERVSIYLFRDQDSYRKVTGRPPWSGGASSVKRRKIYLYATDELVGILAHELCHIYFDSFFMEGQSNPLWLSEGMATLVQTERGLAAPNWLKANLETLKTGGGYELNDLMKVESTSNAGDEDIRLWYSQSYSVVRFLIRTQRRGSFFKFATNIKNGMPVEAALYRAYGMPFNRVKALEYAWRYDINPREL